MEEIKNNVRKYYYNSKQHIIYNYDCLRNQEGYEMKEYTRGLLMGILITISFYLMIDKTLQAEGFMRGDVEWKPLYVKIVK